MPKGVGAHSVAPGYVGVALLPDRALKKGTAFTERAGYTSSAIRRRNSL